MPTASRNERRARRKKRSISQLRHALFMETIARAKTSAVFYAVLAKLGGEVELSKEAIDSAVNALTQLNYVVEPSAMPNMYMVRMVTTGETVASPIPEEIVTPAEVEAGDEYTVEPAVGE